MEKKIGIIRKLTYIYLIPLVGIFGVNFLASIRTSTYFELYLDNEIPSYAHDNIVLMTIFLVIILFCVFVVYKKRWVDSIPIQYLYIGNCVYAFIMCILCISIFRCTVACDAEHVSNMTRQFIEGDFSALTQNIYLAIYPFQLGMIAYFELIYRLFGVDNYFAFQLLNTCCITFVMFMLQRITAELFEEESIRKWETIISLALIPFFMYSSLVYGDIPGFTLAVIITYLTIRYLKTSQWKYGIIPTILLPIAITIKENNAIFLVAFVVIMILQFVLTKKWHALIFALVTLLCARGGFFLVDQMYMARGEVDELSKGTPMISWVVMGIQDTDEINNGCGWYNGYNMNVYVESDGDYDLAVQKSINAIKEAALGHFKNPMHAIYYYYRKFTSAWNDPTFQSQLVNEWYGRHVEPSWAWTYFNYETGRTILFYLMNGLHLIAFFFIAIGCYGFLKNWSLPRAYLLLNVFGGFAFHEFVWESKGRYVLPYYVLLMPVAAFGIKIFVEFISNKLEKESI